MKTHVACLFTALALLSTLNYPLSTFGQGTAFTYQGRLTDGATAANGNYDMQFYLLDALTAGNPVGATNTVAPVAASSGLFNVTLNFWAGVFTGPALWLEIGVRTNGSAGAYTTLAPRQALTPTPYAIFSENIADNAIATTSLQNGVVTSAKIAVPLSLSGSIPGNSVIVGNNSAVSGSGITGNGDTAVSGFGATTGVYGYSSSGTGVSGNSGGSGDGVYGNSPSGNGVHGVSPSASQSGVLGENTGTGPGVTGSSTSANGVYGTSASGDAVFGFSFGSGFGVSGTSSTGGGVAGFSQSSTGTGVYGNSFGSGIGVSGNSTSGDGVYGYSSSANGVEGGSGTGTGVLGNSFGAGTGVSGLSTTGDGVDGYSYGAGDGVFGNSASGNGVGGSSSAANGVKGSSTSGYGVYGFSSSSYGVYGASDSSGGVYGRAQTAGATIAGVWGQNSATGGTALAGKATGSGSTGLYATGTSYAGYFDGNVHINGTLSKSSGTFKIDHPLDPANKYLSHSFVESPDMKNIYDGVVALDGNGEAVVKLPNWFAALNKDFRYQLTCIGGFAPVFVAEEIANNQFKIAGGRPGLKVSWLLTGVRQDAWANAHRSQIEEDKTGKERGTYLHPELFGQPEDKGLSWSPNPEHLKEERTQPPKSPNS